MRRRVVEEPITCISLFPWQAEPGAEEQLGVRECIPLLEETAHEPCAQVSPMERLDLQTGRQIQSILSGHGRFQGRSSWSFNKDVLLQSAILIRIKLHVYLLLFIEPRLF